MRVILAEDSVLLREGLARLLADDGHDVVAGVGDGDALLRAVEEHQPDVAVVDVRMPPTHTDEGLRAALQVRSRWPDVGVLVLSQYVEREYATQLLADGGAAFDPEVVRRLVARSSHADPLARLTDRERLVLDHMAQGFTNASIAEHLYVSQSAVEKHVAAVFDKLDLLYVTGYSRRVLAVLRYLGT